MTHQADDEYAPIDHFDEYLVARDGSVIEKATRKVVPTYNTKWNTKIILYVYGIRYEKNVDEFVAAAFCERPHGVEDPKVLHYNRNLLDNNASNLRLVSQTTLIKWFIKSSMFISEIESNCIPFRSYGKHQFENYFINPDSC